MKSVLVLAAISCTIRSGEASPPWPPQSYTHPSHPWGGPSTSWRSWGSSPTPPTCSSESSLVPATATISAGVVVGTTTDLPSATAPVNKFLGVPFAKSPPERFSPPQAVVPFAEPIQATAWSPACIQQFNLPLATQEFTEGLFNQPTPAESEDCLYLNVYAPSTPPAPGGRAVLFWLYGGSLQFGNAGQPTYDGSAFAAYQDVIVVTTNYRTNVFGFPNAPELPETQENLGFLDQRYALQWVQENIHAFGGDRSRVTIFGESAGAFSVDTLLTTYTTSTAPFSAAILQSGQISYRASAGLPGRDAWDALTAALGCTSATNNLTCVRAASATTIQTIVDEQALAFNPFPDNVTYPSNPASRRASGDFAAVPVMGGTNSQEGRVFEVGVTNLTAFLELWFGARTPQLIPIVEALYPVGTTPGVDTPYDIASALFTLLEFQCGQALWANETAAQGVPTWRYYFDAAFPNWSPLDGTLGVYHSSEIPLVFQTYPGGPVNPVTNGMSGLIPTNLQPTAQQEALAQYMNGAWATFAKNPLRGPGWNGLGTFGGQDLGALGTGGSSAVIVITEISVDAVCAVLLPAFEAYTGAVYGL